MNRTPIFEWDEALGLASCILTDGKRTYYGTASCSEEDREFCSEKTGCEIAFRRARIHMYQGYRDEIKIRLEALNQYYYSINKSKHYNPKSYEARMLQRQIKMTESDLSLAKELLITEKMNLRAYLTAKATFYNNVRAHRSTGQK